MDVLSEVDADWSKVSAQGRQGYMMSKFLTNSSSDGGDVVITIPRDVADALLAALSGAVGE